MRTPFVLLALSVLCPAVWAAESDSDLDAMIQTYAQPEPRLSVYHDPRPTQRNYHAPPTPLRPPPRSVEIQTNHVVGQVYVLDGMGLTSKQTGLPSPPCPSDGVGYAFDENGATTRVLNAVGDQYEQIMYWEDFPTTLCTFGAFAFWRSIQYKVRGLGTPYNPIPGQKLAGYMNMSDIHDYPDNPTGPRSQFFMDVIGQETEHEYGMFLRFMKNGQPSADLVGRQNAHWSWFVNTNGSVMEGSKFFDKGDGTFGTVNPLGGYCSFDLYMWGLLPKEQVTPIWYIDQYRLIDPPDDASFRMAGFCTNTSTYVRINDCPAFAGATVGGQKRTVTVDDVVAALGERDPGYNTGAPHYVTQVFVLTGLPGQQLQRYDRTESYRRAWEEYFYTRSRFRGRAITTIPGAGEMPYDDLPYWEFGTPDDTWTADANITDTHLELAPPEPVTDPKAHPGTLAGTVQTAGATLTAPTRPPYNIKIDTALYDAVKIVMRVEPVPGQAPPTRGRVKWNNGQNGVTFWLLPPESLGNWYTYSADLRDADGWTGTVSGLQVEPLDGPGKFVIDSIKLITLGTVWERQPEPDNLAGATINAIWGDATSDLYAVGTLASGDAALISGDGKSWTKEGTDAPSGTTMYSVWGFGPLDVYAVGKNGVVAARCDENTCGAPRGTFAWVTGSGSQRIAGDSPDIYGLWGRNHDDM
ncbi:MAG TPA: hypothetical protein VKN99_04740, partial [Polyangia bacterium]|nr:hypothetical protein [Polyangia bacterium]